MLYKKEKYWSRFANSYDEDVAYVVGDSLRQAVIKKLSTEHELKEVIEFGCGTGYFTKVIAKNAEHVIATDLSNEMLEVARTELKTYRNVIIQKDDCENSSFPSKRFDTVFMANVIHTIENPYKALKESYRILREGGLLLIISYTDYGTSWAERIELGLRFFRKFRMPPSYYRNYSPSELAELIENAGFKVEENQLIGDRAKALYLKGRKGKI